MLCFSYRTFEERRYAVLPESVIALFVFGYLVAIVGTCITKDRFGRETSNIVDLLKINVVLTLGLLLLVVSIIMMVLSV